MYILGDLDRPPGLRGPGGQNVMQSPRECQETSHVATLLLAQGGQGGPWQGSENTGPYKVIRDSPCGLWDPVDFEPCARHEMPPGWVRSPLAAQVEFIHAQFRALAELLIMIRQTAQIALITRSLFATHAVQLTENNTERTVQSEVTMMPLFVRATYVDTTIYRGNLRRKKKKFHTVKKIFE